MNKYVEMKERHQKEFDNFPMKFAFSDKQFKESMEELGLTEKDTDKIVAISAGGFIRKSDFEAYKEMCERTVKEMQDAINEDKTGEGFIKDMFKYELANHEYCITYELDSTLDALGLTIEEEQEDEEEEI